MIGLVNESGAVVNNYAYDAWGNIVSQTEGISNPIKYAGEYYDDELGMYYLRARYYDPSTGRFISPDPVENGFSRYTYCSNNPVNMIDPSGMESYVFYTTGKNSDFSKQAFWQKEYLEKLGERVLMKEVNDYDSFIYEWNMLGYDYTTGRSVDVNNVVIYSHGNDRTLILEDGSASKALSIDGKNSKGDPIGNLSYLEFKNINKLSILACNAGNIDPYIAGIANVASILSQKVSGATYAYDGNVSFGNSCFDLLGEDIGMSSRLSTTQVSFKAIARYYGHPNRKPRGKLTYHNGILMWGGYYPNTAISNGR